MKKFMILIAVAAMAMACEGPPGMNGPQGPPGKDGKVNKQIVDLNVAQGDWVRNLDNTGSFESYSYRFNVRELTWTILDEGIYCTYRISADGNVIVQEGLGTLFHHKEEVIGGDPIYWNQYISVEYREGGIEIFVTYSDFFDAGQPESMEFRFIALW